MPLDTVTCDCCSLEVKMYCKSCNLKFCAACGGKHVAENISGGHSIVAYLERYAEPVLPNCKDHSSACTSLCADCKIAVCAKCIIESHEDHQCTDLLKESIKRRQTIQRDTTELEISIIQTLQNLFDEMLKKKERFPEHCEPLISAVKNQGAKMHRIVDGIVEKKLAELNDITQKEIKVLEKNIEEISSLLGEAKSLDEKLRKSLRENFATGFLRFELNLEKFDSLDLNDTNLPEFIPKSIDGESIANMFGDLKVCGVKSHKKISIRKSTDFNKETSTTHVVVGTIKSGLGHASLVARVSNEEVWVARRSTLRRMNTKNEIVEEVILSNGITLDICLLLNKYVVHSNSYTKMINVYRNGHMDTLIKLSKWSPFGICATSSGDLLVCLRTDIGHQGKVARFYGSNITQEIHAVRH